MLLGQHDPPAIQVEQPCTQQHNATEHSRRWARSPNDPSGEPTTEREGTTGSHKRRTSSDSPISLWSGNPVTFFERAGADPPFPDREGADHAFRPQGRASGLPPTTSGLGLSPPEPCDPAVRPFGAHSRGTSGPGHPVSGSKSDDPTLARVLGWSVPGSRVPGSRKGKGSRAGSRPKYATATSLENPGPPQTPYIPRTVAYKLDTVL